MVHNILFDSQLYMEIKRKITANKYNVITESLVRTWKANMIRRKDFLIPHKISRSTLHKNFMSRVAYSLSIAYINEDETEAAHRRLQNSDARTAASTCTIHICRWKLFSFIPPKGWLMGSARWDTIEHKTECWTWTWSVFSNIFYFLY